MSSTVDRAVGHLGAALDALAAVVPDPRQRGHTAARTAVRLRSRDATSLARTVVELTGTRAAVAAGGITRAETVAAVREQRTWLWRLRDHLPSGVRDRVAEAIVSLNCAVAVLERARSEPAGEDAVLEFLVRELGAVEIPPNDDDGRA